LEFCGYQGESTSESRGVGDSGRALVLGGLKLHCNSDPGLY